MFDQNEEMTGPEALNLVIETGAKWAADRAPMDESLPKPPSSEAAAFGADLLAAFANGVYESLVVSLGKFAEAVDQDDEEEVDRAMRTIAGISDAAQLIHAQAEAVGM